MGGGRLAEQDLSTFATLPGLRDCEGLVTEEAERPVELPLRAFSDKYLQRFDPQSRQHLINHLQDSWPENNRRCVHPFTWSWRCRDRHAWARKRATVISLNTDATVY